MRSEEWAPGAPAPEGGIPLSIPYLGGREAEYVQDCLDTNFISSVGPFVEKFEKATAEVVGAPYAVATVTGTAALHLSLIVAGVGVDDEVLVPSLTFIAPANAVRYCGAWPVFIDVDLDTWQMSAGQVEQFLQTCEQREGELYNAGTGRRVAAVLVVDILGHPHDAEAITGAAGRYGLPVVEDATESLGASYNGRQVGMLGDIGCFSFNGNKLITTGGGGMVVTAREDWAERVRYLSTQAKDDPVEYVHGEVGYNYRLTNVAAAIGCAQLERLREHVESKRATAAYYREAFESVPGATFMPNAAWAEPVFWLSTILIDGSEAGVTSRELLARLGSQGIQSRPLWEPLHKSKVFAASPRAECPNAEHIWQLALSLPSSVGITRAEQDRVVATILAFAGR